MEDSTPTLRVTRGRTGKLPTPASRRGFVTEFEEEDGSSPPSPSRKSLLNAEKEPAEVPEEVLEVVPAKKLGPVFAVFKSTKKLPDGLCIVRALGGGRYEFVNLKEVDQDQFSSEETGAAIKANGGRRSILAVDDKEWEAAKFNCGQAVRSADKAIFRIRKLPLELRLMIYESAMVSYEPIHHSRGSSSPTLGLALMQTCKQMLEEAKTIFYKNSFSINSVERVIPDHLVAIREHLREVTFQWYGFSRRDGNAIKFFHSCPNLKIFNLVVTKWGSNDTTHYRRQRRHQDVVAIKKFSKCVGFDEIVGLKGLDKVRVLDDGHSTFTVAERKAFRDFLTPILTIPKYIPPPMPEKVVKRARVKKSKKSKRFDNWEDDSDYGGK
ncbi:hypothetical protein IFR05_001216 [Cadophora sp. M221]|nr:hypothetical protein IFR05_001216 [Cadophora sp. M221]